ncbi:MAG: maleylpyruvate isomerase N-terminal domain-containing protein [Acidimicrobiia bacterium]|nr:maleylpyruvate isomerase N-terminal domain-containing protein [Acidimicrobiia bacterium]
MSISRVRVEQMYRAGVDAVETITTDLGAAWDEPACGEWTAAGVTRHLLAVSRWYHGWLDRALEGVSHPPFAADELPAANAADLAALESMPGPDAATAFATSARHYLERVGPAWDLPFGYPYGTVTAGLHAGVAATEWHLHAWDLATAIGRSHEPDDPQGLFLAAGACLARTEGGLKGAVLARLVPLAARHDPWPSLLRRSGR